MASNSFNKNTENREDRTETKSRTEQNTDIAVETETGDRRQETETSGDWYKRASQPCAPKGAGGYKYTNK